MSGFFCVTVCACTMVLFSASRGWATTVSSGRLEIAGDKLYVAGIGHGFHVLDISNPISPKWVGGWNNHTCPVGVQVVDGLAYIANRTSGFEIVDVSKPDAPTPIGHLSTGGDLQTVQVAEHFAYVADLKRGVDVIDIRDPQQPKLAGEFKTKGQGWSAVASGKYLYAGYNGGVLRIFRLDNGSNPKLVKEVPGAGSTSMQITDGKLTTQHFGLLSQMDLQNPTNPTLINNSQIGFGAFGDVCMRDHLMFATAGGLSVLDSSAAGKIKLLGAIHNAGYQSFGVRVRGNFAYVVDGGANLHVIDVSNPAVPIEVNRVGTENFCSQVLSLTSDASGKSSTAISENMSAITNAPPQLAATAHIADGAFSFSLRGVPGGIYDVQASTDLVHWTIISTSTLPESGVLTISDPDAHQFNNRFYRAIKKP